MAERKWIDDGRTKSKRSVKKLARNNKLLMAFVYEKRVRDGIGGWEWEWKDMLRVGTDFTCEYPESGFGFNNSRQAKREMEKKFETWHEAMKWYPEGEKPSLADGTKPYWVSFIMPVKEKPKFEYHGPWWTTGHTDDGRVTVCAAVVATSEAAAKRVIVTAHDDEFVPKWRFCDEKPEDWNPFDHRFPRAEWMRWPWGELA